MKKQKNNKTRLFVETGIQLVGMMLLVFTIYTLFNMDTEPTYTQSDVSALMKFNASEFGCVDSIIFGKSGNILKVNCLDDNKILKQITYFPQFDGVSVVVEPERQECWNETIEKIITCNGVYDCYNRGEPLSLCLKKFCEITIDNFTRCQTIPAVTKTLSGWAVSENDLATEFCKMQTLELIDGIWCVASVDPCSYVVEVDGEIDGIRIYRNIIDNSLCDLYGRKPDCFKFNETKPFTRGEVVEATCPTKKELSCSQKLIRCIGDDGTTKDFESVLR